MKQLVDALEARLGVLDQAYAMADYLVHSGQQATSQTVDIYAGFSDLLTLENVKAAQKAIEEPTAIRGVVERRRRSRILLGIASHYLEAQVATLRDRLVTHKMEVRVPFPGGTVSFLRASDRVSSEPYREHRNEMWKTIGETSRREIAPIALELWKARESCARELGYSHYASMFARLQNLRLDELYSHVRMVLNMSAEVYQYQLDFALHELIGVDQPCATSADLIHLLRMVSEKSELATVDPMSAVQSTLAGLGISLDELPQLSYDTETREGKNPRAAIYFIDPPHHSVISCHSLGGLITTRTLLHETGHGLHVSCMNPHLPMALRRIPDMAVTEAMAFLLDGLVLEPLWLQEILGMDHRQAHSVAELQALYRRVQTRVICAQALYERELSRDLSEIAARKYQRCYYEGSMVLYHPGCFLNNRDTELYALHYFQGLQLEATIREYLQQRFGQAWWRDKRAGHRLREIWWQGHNWTPLTLARACGTSEVKPGPLVRRLTQDARAATGSGP